MRKGTFEPTCLLKLHVGLDSPCLTNNNCQSPDVGLDSPFVNATNVGLDNPFVNAITAKARATCGVGQPLCDSHMWGWTAPL